MNASGENDNGGDSEDRTRTDSENRGRIVTVRSLVGIFLWSVVLVLVLRYFRAAQFVLLAFLAAETLACTFEPLVERIRGPRGIIAIGSMVLLVAAIAGLLAVLGIYLQEPVTGIWEDWADIRQQANDVLLNLSDRLDLQEDLTFDRALGMASSLLTGTSGKGLLGYAADAVFGLVLSVVVVLIATMYLLATTPGALGDRAIQLLPERRRTPTQDAISDLKKQYRWWALGTLFSMTVVGVASLIGYWLVGVKFAVPLGIFAGLTQLIPTFGPMLAFSLSGIIAATQGPWIIIGVVIVYLVVQTLESYVLTPMVMLKVVHIPPVITLFTVIFWGNLLGPAGLILAIPIDLTIWAFLKYHLVEYRKRSETRDEP